MSDTPTPPPSVADALGNAGPLPTITWKGKAYPVAYSTPETIKDTELEAAANAYRHVVALERRLPPAAVAEMKTATLKAINENAFAYGQPSYWGVMGGPDGDAITLLSCLRVRHPEVQLADVKRMMVEAVEDVRVALALTIPRFIQAGADTLQLTPAERAEYARVMTEEWAKARADQQAATTGSAASTPPSADTPSSCSTGGAA